jgi:NAD(P)-dependent dehydrogenase (short-subunit alcohol dehydrogenase family)
MRTIFISGVSRGLGKALAQKFLESGDFVIGTCTSGTADYSHQNLILYLLDFRKQKTISECVKNVKNLNRNIDLVINNAAILVRENETGVTIDELRKTLEVNLFGHISITESLIPIINPGGHIINISSVAGSLGIINRVKYPSYKISKAALNMYTRTLAFSLAGKITVSSVHPGWVKTDMGGIEADLTKEEAAEDIFKFAGSKIETGQFWCKNKKLPW